MNRDVVMGEWKIAVRTLQAAKLLSRHGYPDDAMSRAYYATLHAARAALAVREVTTHSHSGVRRMFGLHLIRSGVIEPEWAGHLGESLDERLAADYDIGTSFSSEQSREECERAEAFVARIRRYLMSNGFTEDELATRTDDG